MSRPSAWIANLSFYANWNPNRLTGFDAMPARITGIADDSSLEPKIERDKILGIKGFRLKEEAATD